jgi:hypothetical protein
MVILGYRLQQWHLQLLLRRQFKLQNQQQQQQQQKQLPGNFYVLSFNLYYVKTCQSKLDSFFSARGDVLHWTCSNNPNL